MRILGFLFLFVFNMTETIITFVLIFRWTFAKFQWFSIDAATCGPERLRLKNVNLSLGWRQLISLNLHFDFFLFISSLSIVPALKLTFFSVFPVCNRNRRVAGSCNEKRKQIIFRLPVLWMERGESRDKQNDRQWKKVGSCFQKLFIFHFRILSL